MYWGVPNVLKTVSNYWQSHSKACTVFSQYVRWNARHKEHAFLTFSGVSLYDSYLLVSFKFLLTDMTFELPLRRLRKRFRSIFIFSLKVKFLHMVRKMLWCNVVVSTFQLCFISTYNLYYNYIDINIYTYKYTGY